MELVYIALLLHKAGKEINGANVKKVAEAVGLNKSDAEIKALVSALDGVDIEAAIKEATLPTAVAQAPVSGVKEKKEEKKEEEKKDESAAAAGLGALFG